MEKLFIILIMAIFIFCPKNAEASCQECCDKIFGSDKDNDYVFTLELQKRIYRRSFAATERAITSCDCCRIYNEERLEIKNYANSFFLPHQIVGRAKATALMTARECCTAHETTADVDMVNNTIGIVSYEINGFVQINVDTNERKRLSK